MKTKSKAHMPVKPGCLILAMAGFIISIVIIIILVLPKHYYFDRIMVTGNDAEGNDVFVHLELGRQQSFLVYDHFYTATVISGKTTHLDREDFISTSPDIQLSKMISAYTNQMNRESAGEDCQLAFTVEGIPVEVDTERLEGDFLVKNTLDYLRYLSFGKADMRIGGEAVRGQVMVDKILSENSAILFPKGFNKVKRTNNALSLWDEEGNSYHIDVAEVPIPSELYPSHTWVLYKDASSGLAAKSEQARLRFERDSNNTPSQWRITLPELGLAEIILTSKQLVSRTKIEQNLLVEGTINDKDGVRHVNGYATFEEVP